MIESCEPTTSLQRVYGRRSLLSILELDRIPTKVSVLDNGCFVTETRGWDSYWEPVHELEHGDITQSLGTLYSAWRGYNRSGSGAAQRQGFCHRYFFLLDKLLACRPEFATAGFFLPVRSFAPECLVIKDDKSVITRLSENSDYIIIEDADLRPQDLIDHATKFSLGSLTIRDMTKTLKLKGNYLYVVWPKAGIAPLLAGEQIW